MSKSTLLRCTSDLMKIYRQAVDSALPEALINQSVKLSCDKLTCSGLNSLESAVDIPLKDTNIHIIGAGKSTLLMAKALAAKFIELKLDGLCSKGALSLPFESRASFEADKGAQEMFGSLGVTCMFGARNNIPDCDSVSASTEILKRVSEACDQDNRSNLISLFILLISGGGSACLTSPRGVSLEEKVKVIKHLAQNGADIVELNKVRRHLSNVKGGRLAAHIFKCNPNSKILSLILSDVIGDPIEFIASGPTVLSDAFNQEIEADAILSRHNYKLPPVDWGDSQLTSRPTSDMRRRVFNQIIGNNSVALTRAVSLASILGYRVESLGSELSGSTDSIAGKLIEVGQSLLCDHERVFVIGGGEATVKKLDTETWGKGGRNQEMALDYILRMRPQSGVVDLFMAGSTDGQDGPTDVAACMSSQFELANDGGLIDTSELLHFKRTHDAYNLWKSLRPDWLVKTGLTGTNVMDLYMLMLDRSDITV